MVEYIGPIFLATYSTNEKNVRKISQFITSGKLLVKTTGITWIYFGIMLNNKWKFKQQWKIHLAFSNILSSHGTFLTTENPTSMKLFKTLLKKVEIKIIHWVLWTKRFGVSKKNKFSLRFYLRCKQAFWPSQLLRYLDKRQGILISLSKTLQWQLKLQQKDVLGAIQGLKSIRDISKKFTMRYNSEVHKYT